MAKDKTSDNTTKKKKSPGKNVGDFSLKVFLGDIISSSFFGKNKFSILIIIGLIIFFTAIKYECQTRMETIAKLEKELAIVKSEGIREQSLYMSRTRESMMRVLVDTMHLDLGIQDQPPYILHYDEK